MKKIDVTTEYTAGVISGGRVTIEHGFNEREHTVELQVARWVCDSFGGEIIVCAESNVENKKTADYRWRDRLWELKVVTEKSVDARVRKTLKQIGENPGGIILLCKDSKVRVPVLEKSFDDRLTHRRNKAVVDVMIIRKWRLEKVLRYKE